MTKYLRQNALTLTLLLACCAICLGLFYNNMRRVPILVATLPVASADGEGLPIAATDDVLDRIIPESNLEDRPTLETAIEVIARTAPCNITVNWRNLQAMGVDHDTLVAASYGPHRNITVRQALSHLWKGQDIGFSVRDNVIFIDTQDNLAKNTITLVYNVRDLIAAAINFKEYRTDEEAASAVSTLITDTINSDSWRDNGGNVGSVREMMGLLIITQTSENHRSIERLLDLLRVREKGRNAKPADPALASFFQMPLTQPASSETAVVTDDGELQIYDVRDLIDVIVRQPDLRCDPNFSDKSQRELAIDELTETISNVVDPGSWQHNGINPALMHEAMGLLIVRQSSKNQRAIQQVLKAMRAALEASPAKAVTSY